MKVPSAEAKQLYDYMVENSCLEMVEGKLFYWFHNGTEFEETYNVYLDELLAAYWLKPGNPGFFVGRAEIKQVLFSKADAFETEIENHQKRYTPEQLVSINKALESFGGQRPTGELTKRQTALELAYYAKYPADVVIRSLQIYLNLDPSRQHGPRYARGIIRGEAAKQPQQVQRGISAAAPVNYRKLKEDWIRSQIKQEEFMLLSPEDQSTYLSKLSSEYDAQFQTQA